MRTEAFKEQLKTAGANWTMIADHPAVRDFGDRVGEYRAVIAKNGLAIADRSERETVVALGADVVPLLQGLLTNNVFHLAEVGSGQYNMAVNVKGRLVADMRLLHIPEMLLIDLEPGMQAAGALRHLRKNVINEDAKFMDRTDRTGRLTFLGEQAAEFLSSIGDWARSIGRLQPYHGTWGVIGDQEVVVQSNPIWGVEAYDLILDIEATTFVWNLGCSKGAHPVGERALETLRIENGVPRFGKELDANIIPLEAGLDWAVSFDKGCYLGQEIIARLDSLGTPKQMLRRLTLDVPVPKPGTKVEFEGKEVGTIRSAVESPREGSVIAFAFLKRDHNEPGSILTVAGRKVTVSLTR